MKKNLLLYILLGFLVVMNGFFLFKHFGTTDKEDPKRPGPANFIAKQLEFDETQLGKFEKLDRVHREKVNTILRDIRSLKDVLFDKVSDEMVDDSEIDFITTEIANLEKEKELETFLFFRTVGEICNENQKARFSKIIKDGLNRQGPPPQGRNGPPGRPRDGERPPPPRN